MLSASSTTNFEQRNGNTLKMSLYLLSRSCILQSAIEAEEIQSVFPQVSAPANKQGDGMLKSIFCR